MKTRDEGPSDEPAVIERLPLTLVVAATTGGVIGRDGKLPWHLPADLRHFRRVTLGHTVIMGRRTYDSIGRPLPKRRNIVVTHCRDLSAPGCEIVHSVEDAVALARPLDPEPRIIGGATLYRQTLAWATRIYWTEVRLNVEGDTHFPTFARDEWMETERRESDDAVFLTLDRRGAARTS